jgi:5,10-methylenetetrahydrofolate reductase
MSGGNVADKQVPWWTLHEVADELGATLRHITCVDSNGRRYKRVVLEYEEEEE